MSKVMGIYVKFTKTIHQIWSCHVTLASNSENFYFSPDSVLNFIKSYLIVSVTKKLQAKNKLGVDNTPQCRCWCHEWTSFWGSQENKRSGKQNCLYTLLWSLVEFRVRKLCKKLSMRDN